MSTDWGMMERLPLIVAEMTDDELQEAIGLHTTGLSSKQSEAEHVFDQAMLVLLKKERASREA